MKQKLFLAIIFLFLTATSGMAQVTTKDVIRVTTDITGATTCAAGRLYYNATSLVNWERNAAGVCAAITSGGTPGNVVGVASSTDNAIARFDSTTGKLLQNSVVTISDTGAMAGAISTDVPILAPIGNVVEQRNGTSAQELRLYNTTDAGTTNYERGYLSWSEVANTFILGVEKGGTGTQRALRFYNGTGAIQFVNDSGGLHSSFDANGSLNVAKTILFSTDNAADIGASGANRPRNLYVATNIQAAGIIGAGSYITGTNCADSAGAAACGSAAAGHVVIDAAATTVVVSTTAVTANSQITPTFDSSLGTRLGVTCNTTIALPAITARTGTSFTITVAVAPITNPACFGFTITN